MELIDTHAHLYWSSFDEDRAAVLENARAAGVQHIVIPGTNLATSQAARDLCQAESGLHFGAGFHPSDSAQSSPQTRAAITDLCKLPECVAVGEAGLDFFHKHYPDPETQLDCFRWQIELSLELGKPLIIHCRDAHAATLELLSEYTNLRGVLHCFTMGPSEARSYVELGLMISFSGVVTYPRNEDNRAAARSVPEDSILVETDGPFLAPQAERGKRNEPAFVRHVLDRVAQERSVSPSDLAATTSANAKRLFGIADV